MEGRLELQSNHDVLAQQVDHSVHVHHHDDSTDQERHEKSCCGWLERQLKERQILTLTRYRLSHQITFDLFVNIPVDWIIGLSFSNWSLWLAIRLIKLVCFGVKVSFWTP